MSYPDKSANFQILVKVQNFKTILSYPDKSAKFHQKYSDLNGMQDRFETRKAEYPLLDDKVLPWIKIILDRQFRRYEKNLAITFKKNYLKKITKNVDDWITNI